MNTAILQPEVQAFLRDNEYADPSAIALKKSPFPEINSSELAVQIQSRHRIQKKLPNWHAHEGVYYPPLLALEQCSSERTAAYKAGLLQLEKNNRIIDLTGGFGVDTLYLAKVGGIVTHCEVQTELSTIARHNLRLLSGDPIEFKQQDGIEVLLNTPPDQYDFAFIDPSRRVQGQKVFNFHIAEPNILTHQEDIHARVRRWMIKAAPLLDISSALKCLRHVKDVHIIGLNHEVKELLFILERDWSGSVQIHATRLLESGKQTFSYSPAEERIAEEHYSDPTTFLYEPDPVLMKAGCFKLIAQRFKLKKLHPNTHLYTSTELCSDFPGKIFRVADILSFGTFKKQKQVPAASIVSRNFPIKADQLRAEFRIQEDPKDYLFFFRDHHQRLSVAYTRLVS